MRWCLWSLRRRWLMAVRNWCFPETMFFIWCFACISFSLLTIALLLSLHQYDLLAWQIARISIDLFLSLRLLKVLYSGDFLFSGRKKSHGRAAEQIWATFIRILNSFKRTLFLSRKAPLHIICMQCCNWLKSAYSTTAGVKRHGGDAAETKPTQHHAWKESERTRGPE